MVGACQCYADAKAEARVHEQAESQAAKAPVWHKERRRLFYGPPDAPVLDSSEIHCPIARGAAPQQEDSAWLTSISDVQ
jgi:hypothetical protein